MSRCYLRSFVKLRLTANYRRIIAYTARSAQTSTGDEVKVYETMLTAALLFFTSFTVIKRTHECSRPQFRHGARLSRETSEANREPDPSSMEWNGTERHRHRGNGNETCFQRSVVKVFNPFRDVTTLSKRIPQLYTFRNDGRNFPDVRVSRFRRIAHPNSRIAAA